MRRPVDIQSPHRAKTLEKSRASASDQTRTDEIRLERPTLLPRPITALLHIRFASSAPIRSFGGWLAPERSLLGGPLEVDEFYFGGIEGGRGAGRNTDSTKAIVVVTVEFRGQASGRLRLGVVPDLEQISRRLRRESRQSQRDLHTDVWQGHRRLAGLSYDHRAASQRQAEPGEWLLPRAHRSISNFKAWLHGTHRDVSREHLQVYLDEFVLRHNRRRTPMAAFQTLLDLGANRPPHHLQPDPRPRRLTHLTERTGYAGRPLCRSAGIPLGIFVWARWRLSLSTLSSASRTEPPWTGFGNPTSFRGAASRS